MAAVDVRYRLIAQDDTQEGLKEAKDGLSNYERSVQATAAKLSSIGTSMTQMGVKLMLRVTAPLLGVGALMVKGADTQEKALSALRTSIEAVGNTSKVSVENIGKFASEMQTKTVFGDEVTLQAIALLESLTALDEEGIMKIMPHVMDLATKLDMDLVSAATAVGKTLGSETNALSRYGVLISMIGTPIERLGPLIEEMSKKFKGAAEDAAKAGAGPLTIFKNRLGDIAEQFGMALIPYMNKFLKSLEGLLSWLEKLDEPTRQITLKLVAFGAALGPIMLFGGWVLKAAAGIAKGLGVIGGAFSSIVSGLGALIGGGGAVTAGLIGGPFGLAIAGFAALSKGAAEVAKDIAYWLMDVAFPKLQAFCTGIINWMRDARDKIVGFISDIVNATRDWVESKLRGFGDKVRDFTERTKGFFRDLYDKVVGHSYIPDLAEGVIDWVGKMTDEVEADIEGMVEKVGNSFNKMRQNGVQGISALGGKALFSGGKLNVGLEGGQASSDQSSAFFASVGNALSKVVDYFVQMIVQTETFTDFMEKINGILGPMFEQIAVPLLNALQPIVDLLLVMISAILPTLVSMFNALGSFIQTTLPFWTVLGKAVVATGTILGWLVTKLIAFGQVLYYAVTFQWGKIAGVQWGGNLTSQLDAAMAAFKAGLTSITTESVSGTSGAGVGATYTQARQIIIQGGASLVTVNTDVLVGGTGGFQELAVLMAREIKRVEALGLV